MALPAAPILIRIVIAGLAYTGVGALIFAKGQEGRRPPEKPTEADGPKTRRIRLSPKQQRPRLSRSFLYAFKLPTSKKKGRVNTAL